MDRFEEGLQHLGLDGQRGLDADPHPGLGPPRNTRAGSRGGLGSGASRPGLPDASAVALRRRPAPSSKPKSQMTLAERRAAAREEAAAAWGGAG